VTSRPRPETIRFLPFADIGESDINGCNASVSGHSAGFNVVQYHWLRTTNLLEQYAKDNGRNRLRIFDCPQRESIKVD
jgi:hypothetical protein